MDEIGATYAVVEEDQAEVFIRFFDEEDAAFESWAESYTDAAGTMGPPPVLLERNEYGYSSALGSDELELRIQEHKEAVG